MTDENLSGHVPGDVKVDIKLDNPPLSPEEWTRQFNHYLRIMNLWWPRHPKVNRFGPLLVERYGNKAVYQLSTSHGTITAELHRMKLLTRRKIRKVFGV